MSAEPAIVTKYRKCLREMDTDDLTAWAYNSPAAHFGLFLEIKDKNGRFIRPTPNVLQLRISEVIETLRARCPGLRIRIVAVKPRRAGLSTFSLACGYHEAQRRPIEGITIADCKDNSEMLTDRLSEYSTHDSFPWGNRLTQDATHSKAWSNGSKWVVDTAENPDAGVGGTRQFGHYSEVAKYPQTTVKNDRKTMTASLPALNGDDTTVIAESTPEGMGSWFQETFDEADWLEDFLKRWNEGYRPEEAWIKVFAAWWEFAENARQQPVSPVEQKHIEATLTDEEREDREKFGLTYEQLAWRRDTIDGQCGGDPKVFLYYYPKDPVSCWIASGNPRFDMEALGIMIAKAKSRLPETGYLIEQDTGKVTFDPQRDGQGEILVWERPRIGLKYCVFCDPATGESQTVGADPDRTTIGVLRAAYYDPGTDVHHPTKLVARLKPPFYGDDDVAGAHIARLSKWYGSAIVALEVNQGLHVLRVLKDLGVPCYKRVVYSARTRTKEEQYGFKLTDANQRRLVIEGLASAIRTGEIDIPCEHTLKECRAFVTYPNGKAAASPGNHDDDVMGIAMGWEVIPSATIYKEFTARAHAPRDRGRHGWRRINDTRRGY